MKASFFRALLPATAFLFLGQALQSQCDGCVPNLTCTASPAYPTLCPASGPDATAGVYYQADFTFWMPATFSDPGTGFTVDLEQITITGATGLPFGLTFTANEPSGVYYPPQNEYGCARVCGTPIIPGTYTVTIDVLAHVSASGISLDVPQTFSTVLTVLPGSGGNTSFSYAPVNGCGAVTTVFEALIDGSPSPTTYAWDFGNGNTSDAALPPAQTYDEPGTYLVSLQTVIGGYVLGEVILTGVNSNWCGDVEEPNLPIVGCTGSPDLYFVLTDANGGSYTSSTQDNTTTAQWQNVQQLLSTPPYSISFYDEDAVSGDDLLGTFNIPGNGEGTYFINVAGGTTGSLVIANVPQQTFLDSALITVLQLPAVALALNSATGELCAQDSTLSGYNWLLDGTAVPELSGACVTPTGPGLWSVIGTDAAGCSDTSNTVVVCPQFEITRNGAVLQVPSGYLTYAWTYEGSPVGGNDPFLILQGDGLYTVVVDAGNGCELTLSFLHDTTGLDERESNPFLVGLFPNPNHGTFTLAGERIRANTLRWSLLDASGRELHHGSIAPNAGRVNAVLSLDLPAGAYLLRLIDDERHAALRVMVR